MMKIDYDKFEKPKDDISNIFQEADYFGFSLDYAMYLLEQDEINEKIKNKDSQCNG